MSIPSHLATTTIRSGGAEAVIAHHGAHVLSFVPEGGQDLLWVSEQAIFKPGKAIRGGIPVCWPWFADHPTDSNMPAHGVARTSMWDLESTTGDSANFALVDTAETRELWSHSFKLHLIVTVTPTSLEVVFEAKNRGHTPVTTTAALHTYFSVSDASAIDISGLEGTNYIDKMADDTLIKQDGEIRISAEVDRIYLDTTADCLLADPGMDRTIRVAKSGSQSTVVWNPWEAKARRMRDFGDEEYKEMVCIETCNAGTDIVVVAPGEVHRLVATLSVEPEK